MSRTPPLAVLSVSSKGSLLSIPNGVMAAINLENLSNRKGFLFNPVISLRYETTPEKLLQGLENIRNIMKGHPRVDPAGLRVCFRNFGASSLEVEAFANILTSEMAEYILIREQLLLEIMRAVESAGAAFAFPSQTLYLTQDSSSWPERK
jgi:MscS family membrane protein